jgi:hypothetical protein
MDTRDDSGSSAMLSEHPAHQDTVQEPEGGAALLPDLLFAQPISRQSGLQEEHAILDETVGAIVQVVLSKDTRRDTNTGWAFYLCRPALRSIIK